MAYAGIQMFMEKLKQLINCNDIPLINNPLIISERPQFQLLYEELGSMIQTYFINENHRDVPELQRVNDLKKRFIYAAEEAQYIVDLFLSGVHNERLATYEEGFKRSLNLDQVRRSFESIKVEFMSLTINNMKLDSSQTRPERTLNQSSVAARTNSLGSKRLLDEIMVGIDDDAELIRDKLVEDQKKLDVVSIVGMGGIGKTTLATKVFNDGFVKYHFHVRVWVTVSQTYDKRGVLIQILESIRGQLHLENATDSRLRELIHKQLMGKRYLIVIDDIWSKDTWDQVKLAFPHENAASRILLTSRLIKVAKHANSDGFIHHLGYLNKERSWELLRKKVFSGDINKCPKWSIKYGMQIVKNCKGLPLAVVVIAGILSKQSWSEEWWGEIAEKTSSYIVGEQNGCLEILALSYHHLPLHLRECFLYLGGFPADHKFEVKNLIWLWMAEGFIQQDASRSLEDIAESYLMDLIDRNLVIVSDRRKSDGAVKACTLHDLVRELCARKAKEDGFFLKIERLIASSQFSNVITPTYKPVRMFIKKDVYILGFSYHLAQNLRSLIVFFSNLKTLSDDIAKYFYSFRLLRVLDLRSCSLNDFPRGMELLLHLRYLAIWKHSEGFPSSICKLWGLQTLIYITTQRTIQFPRNISDLVNLRHLWVRKTFSIHSIKKPMNLLTISSVMLGNELGNLHKCFPYIKELTCSTCRDEECDFKSLIYLEKLKVCNSRRKVIKCTTFPATLRALTLVSCRLPWRDMSIIQSLPNLEALKLTTYAFMGRCWNTDGQKFQQLKFLRLEKLNVKRWEVCTPSFPCLRQLELLYCYYLEEAPLEIGDIPTLELIRVSNCSDYVKESVRIIQEEQNYSGNYDLKIELRG